GRVGTASALATATNVNPAPTINGLPASAFEGTPLTATAGYTDPGTADTVTFAWAVTKNGGPFAAGGGPNFTFTPDDNGTYVVTLTTTDDDLGVGVTQQTVNVTNVAPHVAILTANNN